MRSDPLWRVVVIAPALADGALEAALAEHCETVSRFADGAHTCRVEGLACREPDRRALDLALAVAAGAAGVPAPQVTIEKLPARDWLAESRERFAAFRIRRFLIREPEDETCVPPGLIVLRIEAAAAFGSGRHGSTEGCLRALQMLRWRRIRRTLDLGCGSGILAIAAAKLWRVPVLASDIDPHAVGVARANARLNGMAHLVRVVVAEGWRSPAIAARRPFDLVLCNVLSRPLKRMAGDLARHLAPEGTAILAGLLAGDGNDVLAAHRALGLGLVRTIDVEGWRTLVLRRAPPSALCSHANGACRSSSPPARVRGVHRIAGTSGAMTDQGRTRPDRRLPPATSGAP